MEILRAEHLQKHYGNGENLVKAVDDISFSVEKGEFVSIVGTSGSGKTTLLNLLGGLDYADSGEVIIDGKSLSGMKDDALTIFRRRNIGFIFQNYNLVTVINVYKNITLPVWLDGNRPDEKYISRISGLLGIEKKWKAYPNQLSGGQQQRVAIARALAGKPAIILEMSLQETWTPVPAVYDRKWTVEAIFNLLDNAVKYGREGTKIHVRLSAYQLYARVDVENEGTIIPKEDMFCWKTGRTKETASAFSCALRENKLPGD